MARAPGRRRVIGFVLGLALASLLVPGGWVSPKDSAAQAGPNPPQPAPLPAQTGPIPTRPLVVATKPFEPFAIRQGDTYTGFSIDLLDQISKRVGFTYQLQTVSAVGDQLLEVESGHADLAVAGISITHAREHVVDFCFPMYASGLQVMVSAKGAAPQPSLLRASGRLWRPVALIFVLLFVVAHVAWLLERRRNPDHFPRSYFRGLGEGLWWGSVTLTTVGYGDRTPRSVLGRVLGIVWMMTAIVLIANLTARITTAFTVQELQSSINGPNDLVGKRVATVRATTSNDYLQGRDLSPVVVDSTSQAFELLKQRDVDAVVFDSPTLLYFANTRGKGSVRVVGPVFNPQDYGIAVQLGSPLRKPINEAILSLIEDGTYARIQKAWFGTD